MQHALQQRPAAFYLSLFYSPELLLTSLIADELLPDEALDIVGVDRVSTATATNDGFAYEWKPYQVEPPMVVSGPLAL